MLLRRAWWRSVLQIAAVTTAVVLLVGGVALALVNTDQSRALDATLAAVLAEADDVGDPPPGSYLARPRADAPVEVTPGAPGPVAALLVAAVRDPAAVGRDVTTPGAGVYRIRVTNRPDGRRWVIATDLTVLRTDQRRVLQAMLLAEAAGLAGAIGVAALLSRRSVEPLARALELQRRFVADASHELRAPLTVLHTRTQILAADPTLDPDGPLGRGLNGLVADTRVFGEVIDDLLADAELERRLPPATPVDLDALVAAVVTSMAGHAHARGITLDHVRDTPDAGPVLVTGHRAALRRAVTALVDNAIDHTEQHGCVLVATARHDRHATVTVTDDGIGFDPADAERIFTRSHHHARGERPRFGLGLALVREIAHAHGGTVTATAHPGQGARFTLTLSGHPSPRTGESRTGSGPGRYPLIGGPEVTGI